MTATPPLRRGIYLLPTVFTVGNLFCGFSAVVLATRGSFSAAALLIIVAGVLDGLDGRIARLTGTTSDFGVQFDSLADIASFGIAPGLLAYHWVLQPLDRVGWLVAFIYVVCAAMRLARFNIQAGRGDRRYFAGLPSPAAAGAFASLTFALPELGRSDSPWTMALVALLLVTLGLLMISRFRYRAFTAAGLRIRRPYTYVLPLAFILVAVVVQPQIWLPGFATLYVLSAPAWYVWSGLRNLEDRGIVARPTEADVIDEPAAR